MVAHGAVDQFARVLASAGVDVRNLFADFGVNRDEGGPFVPAGAAPRDPLTTEKLAGLQAMVKTLPVAVPMEGRVTSPFGERTDPFNGGARRFTLVSIWRRPTARRFMRRRPAL